MPSSKSSAEYIALPSSPELGNGAFGETSYSHSVPIRNTSKHSIQLLFYLAYVLCIGCSIFNIWIMMTEGPRAPVPSVSQPADVSTLERPSPYVDFEQMHWDSSIIASLPPIVNYPFVVGQVSRSEPHKIFPVDTRQWLTDWGRISPYDRQVFITTDVSTVVQFRVQDFGMENCAVAVEVPSKDVLRSRHKNNNIQLSGYTTVEVWRLDTDQHLNVAQLSKSSLPPRKGLVGTLDVKRGNFNATETFPCTSRSLQTFELVCSGKYCHIDFWQDKDKPVFGVYLMQKTSLK